MAQPKGKRIVVILICIMLTGWKFSSYKAPASPIREITDEVKNTTRSNNIHDNITGLNLLQSKEIARQLKNIEALVGANGHEQTPPEKGIPTHESPSDANVTRTHSEENNVTAGDMPVPGGNNSVTTGGTNNVTVITITNGTQGVGKFEQGDGEFQRCPQLSPNTQCRFYYSGSTIRPESQAVLFRPFTFHGGDPVPSSHPPEQKWIFHETEAPYRSWKDDRLPYDFWASFNLSIIYTDDADIQHSRFAFECPPDPHYLPSPERNYAKENKSGGVLWMVGNCKGTSGRELYVKEMQKYIEVDVYGPCGKGVVCGEFGELKVDCVKEFISHYKFYLAFENSFCDNYYTEKLTKLIDVNTIPVVMGLVNYTRVMPEGSFIDVRDFSSPKALADHLLYLSNNDTAYNKYIEKWRSVKCHELYPNRYMCRLCHYLHQHNGQVQTIPDARKLWGVRERCQSPVEFFKKYAPSLVSQIN